MRDADFVKAIVARYGSAPMPKGKIYATVIVDSGEECGMSWLARIGDLIYRITTWR